MYLFEVAIGTRDLNYEYRLVYKRSIPILSPYVRYKALEITLQHIHDTPLVPRRNKSLKQVHNCTKPYYPFIHVQSLSNLCPKTMYMLSQNFWVLLGCTSC